MLTHALIVGKGITTSRFRAGACGLCVALAFGRVQNGRWPRNKLRFLGESLEPEMLSETGLSCSRK